MRRILSLPGLAVAVWVSCLAFLGLLAVMVAVLAWHPHFLLATIALGFVIVTGLVLIIGASSRLVRGPDRRHALSCLLLGAAPLWFLAGFFLYGLAVGTGRKVPLNPAIKLLAPLAESLMDLDARFVYPRRTAGEKVVMISAPMPDAEARAQVAAMDRHVRALETRLGRPTKGTIHWVRGPLLGIERHAVFGLCMGSRPGQEASDAEGLGATDRHEVAHCMLTSHCSARFDPPAMLTEGWAQANQGTDPSDQAIRVREGLEKGEGYTLRQLTGPDWYDRHEWPVYLHGAVLVNFILERLGPERFLRLYTTCSQSTFESDCRRILGLDLDGLDAAYRASIERLVTQAGSVERRRLERLRLGPGVNAAGWKAFLAEYFAAAERMLAPYHHVRMTSVWKGSTKDAEGRAHTYTFEVRVLRSGEFASLRRQADGGELAYLAHPRRSILARRPLTPPWEVEDESRRTPEQSRHRALDRIDDLDAAGRGIMAPLMALSEDLADRGSHEGLVVAGFDRSDENGRPRVRVRIEDHSPAAWQVPWRAATYVLAADDLFAVQSVRLEGVGPDKATYQSEFAYDRHEGVPVLRSEHTSENSPRGTHATTELKVVERRFGPIPEAEFDPDRFLDGPQVKAPVFDPYTDEPSMLRRWFWLPFPIGTLGLICGAVLSLGTWRDRRLLALRPPTNISMSPTNLLKEGANPIDPLSRRLE
jgi:hypothetical protein